MTEIVKDVSMLRSAGLLREFLFLPDCVRRRVVFFLNFVDIDKLLKALLHLKKKV